MSNKSEVKPPKPLKKALIEEGNKKLDMHKKLENIFEQKGLVNKKRAEKRAAIHALVDMAKEYPELMKKAFYRKAQTTAD
tara:strand:- start:135 stop:374 length:240 start_codon:yes stop_codon:yes gene_type:complete